MSSLRLTHSILVSVVSCRVWVAGVVGGWGDVLSAFGSAYVSPIY